MTTAKEWIEKLQLLPHPEGGFFRETYRSEAMENFDGFRGLRSVCTGIYFMLTQGRFSAFHRIKSDEMWHFYAGDPVEIFWIDHDTTLHQIQLGINLNKGQVPQAVVPTGCWFGSRVLAGGKFSLAGCTVAPGFDFEDFEMADRVELMHTYPQHEEIIRALTR